jgi:hypothetical protein
MSAAAMDLTLKRHSPHADFHVSEIPTIEQAIAEDLEKAESLCAELNLKSAYEQIARIRDDKPWAGQTFIYALKDAVQRIEDDLKHVSFLLVPLSKIEYYDRAYFTEKVEARFKDAIDDMREAATCFALGRWTGVAHHCMGVVQEGMIALGSDLGRPLDKYLHDWNDMITELESAIADKRTAVLGGSKNKATAMAKSNWNKQEAFYSEVLSDVRDMRKAWRNPGFHFRLLPFDEGKAKKVLEKVRDFMQNLAENLP